MVSVRPRAIGEKVLLRRGTSDALVAKNTFIHAYHLPPTGLQPRVIWDLGSNIGLTVAHYASLYPEARIVGVEPDPVNAALAIRNVGPWRGRCRILEHAVWHDDREAPFVVEPGAEYAGRIGGGGNRRVSALSLTTLLEAEEHVDLLKMDIEGAEQEVLRRNTGWATKVGCIKVEVHEPYTSAACADDLRRLGFESAVEEAPFCVVGVRPDLSPQDRLSRPE